MYVPDDEARAFTILNEDSIDYARDVSFLEDMGLIVNSFFSNDSEQSTSRPVRKSMEQPIISSEGEKEPVHFTTVPMNLLNAAEGAVLQELSQPPYFIGALDTISAKEGPCVPAHQTKNPVMVIGGRKCGEEFLVKENETLVKSELLHVHPSLPGSCQG